MNAQLKWTFAAVGSLAASVAGAVGGLMLLGLVETAAAQCGGSSCQPPAPPPGCGHSCQPPAPPHQPPPPVCCQPPSPPPPPPVVCCQPPSPPPVTIVTPPVVAIAIAGAQAQAGARANAYSSTNVFYGGGGGGGGGVAAMAATSAALNVQGAEGVRRVPYQMRRRMERTIVIQAVCIDDRAVPHAASQVFRERDVIAGYVGELYRCIAGTHMQVTFSNWEGRVDFSGGETISCQRGEALWYERGEMTCRRQTPQRDCFERSRLRMWGAGVKVLRIVREEVVTAWREERVEGAFTASGLVMDGGVGGMVY